VLDLTAPTLSVNPNFAGTESRSIVVGKSTLPEEVALGRRLFTSAKDSRISGSNGFACASCHPDGRHDGLVWQVSVGPRQTPILADRLAGTAPYNWLGTEEALVENIHKTIVRLGGSQLEPKEAAALARYVEQYLPPIDSPHRDAVASNAAVIARGRELFHSAEVGCSSCHDSGRGFLDGAKHEIGTTSAREVELWKSVNGAKVAPGGPPQEVVPQQKVIEPRDRRFQTVDIDILPVAGERPAEAPVAYDTPGLRHLWASAPYLHDGSVPTLEALLTTGNPGDRMGKTSHLGPADVAALAAYLRTL
jgi:cytochrome c peroxidase